MESIHLLTIDDLEIVVAGPELLPLIVQYVQGNRKLHQDWFQSRGEDFYSESFWSRRIVELQEMYAAGRALPMTVLRPARDRILGNVSLWPSRHPTHWFVTGGMARKTRTDPVKYFNALLEFAATKLPITEIIAQYSPDNRHVARLLNDTGFHLMELRQVQPLNGQPQNQLVSIRMFADE